MDDATRKPTVLIIDTDSSIVEIYRRIVLRHFPDVEVNTAASPEEGLKLLEQQRHEAAVAEATSAEGEINLAKSIQRKVHHGDIASGP